MSKTTAIETATRLATTNRITLNIVEDTRELAGDVGPFGFASAVGKEILFPTGRVVGRVGPDGEYQEV